MGLSYQEVLDRTNLLCASDHERFKELTPVEIECMCRMAFECQDEIRRLREAITQHRLMTQCCEECALAAIEDVRRRVDITHDGALWALVAP